MKLLTKAVLTTAIAALLATPAIAEDKPFESQIEARQGYYKLVKANFGVLGAMVKGKAEYSADKAAMAAANIQTLSQLNNGMLWPEGSDNSQLDYTNAKPEIWENFADVQEKGGNWRSAVETLAAEAGNGPDALKASFGPVGKACKACHDDYKAK